MDNKQNAFLEKMKGLSAEELLQYRVAATQARRFIDVLGIVCILGMLIFPVIFVVLPLGALVFFLSRVSMNINYSLLEINMLIQKRINS